jgi:hypothetical protein
MSVVRWEDASSESQAVQLGAGELSITSRDTFAAWILRVRNLTPEQREEFMKHSHSQLEEYVREFEDIAKLQVETSKTRKIAQFAKPLYTLCTVLTPISSDPSQLDPSHSSLVLGGVAYVLSLSQKFLGYGAKIRDQLSSMLEQLPVVEKFRNLYSTHELVQKIAVELCLDILQFCVEASKFFLDKKGQGKSSLKLLTTSAVSPFEDRFGEIVNRFDNHLASFESCTKFVNAESLQKLRQDHDKRDRKDEERNQKDEERQRGEFHVSRVPSAICFNPAS